MLDKTVPCCFFRRSRTNESFQLLHVEYIRRPRVKTVVISLPLYKVFRLATPLTGFQYLFDLVHVVFLQNFMQFLFVKCSLYLLSIQICKLVSCGVGRKASIYSEYFDRPRLQVSLSEGHSSLADSHLVTDVIVPLCGFSLSTKQALSHIVLIFYSHLGGGHAYAPVIGVIVKIHEVL